MRLPHWLNGIGAQKTSLSDVIRMSIADLDAEFVPTTKPLAATIATTEPSLPCLLGKHGLKQFPHQLCCHAACSVCGAPGCQQGPPIEGKEPRASPTRSASEIPALAATATSSAEDIHGPGAVPPKKGGEIRGPCTGPS